MIISGIIFNLFYFYQKIYNDNLKYEFNEKGSYLIFRMYSNLLSLILTGILNKIFIRIKEKNNLNKNKIL